MEPSQRFTLLTFPQFFDGHVLRVNVVFLPRNQNPLMAAIEGAAPIPDAPAFADAKLSFVARIVSGLSGLPGATPALPPVALVTLQPTQARPLFEALANQFTITNKGAQNTNLNVNNPANSAPAPLKLENSVKKYLPLSYRGSFNFVAPRSPGNGVIDDSYHCALRDAKPDPTFQSSPDEINWGQVFASAMRQPQLAQALGIIYHAELVVTAAYFPKGGWLYVDLADGSDYKTQQTAAAAFVKRYAARIPVLVPGQPRSVFGAIQFPVLPAAPPGNYDGIFIEAAEYDDGFAKVVHAFQPVSHNLLAEKSDGFHPTKEVGIRLGWDDEQILIWYLRQLAEDASAGPMQRVDASIGALGYKIDVREKATPPGAWQSLNAVNSKAPLTVVNPVTKEALSLGDFTDKELPYQVYPSQIDGDRTKSYWLPMYFAAWSGKTMVLPDDEAAQIYRNDEVIAKPAIHVKPGLASNLNKIYEAAAIDAQLRYGGLYEFRVRLGDISGGGPTVDQGPAGLIPIKLAECHFKRFVAPNSVRIDGLPENSDSLLFAGNELTMHRPILGYPAVVFTAKYADPITVLKQASHDTALEAFGIPDPDVDSVEITVEVQTLKMDNLLSVSGRESYIKFYTTTRKFPTLSPVFDDELQVPLRYVDCRVLKFGDPADLGDLGVNQVQIDALDELVLPTARTIRLTVRAVCEAKPDYYGLEEPDAAFNTRYGRTLQFQLTAEAKQNDPAQDDRNLGSQAQIRAIYLQPDPPFLFDGNLGSLLFGKEVEKPPDMIQRLAQQLGLESNQLTLVGKKGSRVQFGCSHRIRHTLSPDNSSITFASKGDLAQHWLCCITLEMERDWTWDNVQDRSFVVQRASRFKEDDVATETDSEEVGAIEIKRTVPFTALLNPDRSRTTLVFIDAVEAKNSRHRPPPNDKETRFPDLIEVQYTLQPQLKKRPGFPVDFQLPELELPITVPPTQVPRIVSAGVALSPYVRNERYSETEPRRKFLWIEFEEPVRDVKDNYFARVLAYAPDQLISNNSPELLIVPEEPSLPIDPESIRVVTPLQSNDQAGLEAMQPMERSTDSDRFYLLPLPPGLHPESAEMFGFFTYELRVGHYRYSDTTEHHQAGDDVWTTAQGRFGRAVKIPGIQHPAPTLTCTVNRDEEKVYVTSPYAVAVYQGRNVTADPPRTEIWALLYAQVKQADNQDFRNILLDDRILDVNVRVEHDKLTDWKAVYTVEQRNTLKRAALTNLRDDVAYAAFGHAYKLADASSVNKDATKYGTVIWSNSDVAQALAQYGLPPDSPLSVLCVEVLPQITNVYDYVSGLGRREVRDKLRATVGSGHIPEDGAIQEGLARRASAMQSVNLDQRRPLSDQLGDFRILRTSPLMEVPFVCCPNCS